jgi:hypothetical protein
LSVFQISQNIIHFDRNVVKISFNGFYQAAFFFYGISVGEAQIVNIGVNDCYRSVCLVDLQIYIHPHRTEYVIIAFGEH